ncbi:E3 ubiquitin-protein ligase sspH1 [compost metagenome]
MPTPTLIEHSIDTLIASRLPAWMTHASIEQLVDLNHSLRQQQALQPRLQALLGNLTPLDAFAAPLLEAALAERLQHPLDVRKATLHLHLLEHFVPDRAELPGAVRERTLQHSLLAAALHNFSHGETLSFGLSEGCKLTDEQGQTLALSPRSFAELCRTLDLGGRYQTYLMSQLKAPDEREKEVSTLLEQGQRAALECALRLAVLQGEIGQTAYRRCLAAMAGELTSDVRPMALRVLGKRVRGAVAFEMHRDGQASGQLAGVLCWLPDDPHGALSEYASWEALFLALGKQFRLPAYAAYFQRFISERDRERFTVALAHAMAQGGEHTPVVLDGRHEVIGEPLFQHLRRTQLDTLFDDAKLLAVPTQVQDSIERDQRLHFYARFGLDLLGLASFFVPGLGLPILGIGAIQVADDVYEGYVDWQLGDRQGALEHVISVAANVVQAGIGLGAGAVTQHLLQRSAFVDGLAPVETVQGQRKLIDPSLRAYALPDNEAAIGQRVTVAGKTRLRTHQAAYEVTGEPSEHRLVIQHPQRADAYAPWLRHHGDGAWQHELDMPQRWQGAELFRRLGSGLAEVDEQVASQVMQSTGFNDERLRLLHLQAGRAPARLLDALQRHQLHEQFPLLRGAAFEAHVVEQQAASTRAEQVLRRDFPGLTARGAREVVEQADERLVERMTDDQRVPLHLAEQARWWVRDSRLDRACAGLRQAAAVNDDSERLAFGLLAHWVAWPESLGVELREEVPGEQRPAQMGSATATEIRTIVKAKRGYQALDDAGSPLAGARADDNLVQALLWQLSEAQRLTLGDAGASAAQLADALAQRAFDKREAIAGLLGMAPVGAGMRPPVRLADGRFGYPLSGRGESSSESLRHALRRLFPGYSDSQVEAFLASSQRYGMTPWDRYFRLLEAWRSLDNALLSWRRESANPVQALRRTWVARAIRRAWQRQSRDAHGNCELYIHGWRVGTLPRLPDSVDFSHVTHLSLRNMSLLTVETSFLQRFSAVRRLDLRGNLLQEVPEGIEQLAELGVLHLSENHIALTAASERRVMSLRRLHALNLSNNLLGRSPDVSALTRLRSLYLRATGLRALPQALLESPSLTLIDLRENGISELSPAAFNLMRADPYRVCLHDNPLSVQSVTRLRELLEAHAAQVLPVRYHEASLEDERLRWLHGVSSTERSRRLAQWDALAAEDGAQDLFRFFTDFSRSRDFTRQPEQMCRRVWNIIEACELNAEVRDAVFQQAAGPRSCADQMLLILSALEVRTLAAQRTAGLQGPQAMRPLLRLGRELFRLDEVDRIATRHIQRVRTGDPYTPIDDVEVHLAYRVGLAETLSLPGQPARMNYAHASGVNSSDLDAAEREVWDAETRDVLSRSLAERDFWQRYLQEAHAEAFDALNEPFHARVDALYDQRQTLADQAYLDAVQQVQAERSLAERAWVLELTRQAYERHPS